MPTYRSLTPVFVLIALSPEKPTFDIWQHLVNISKCSFSYAMKRSREQEAESALCMSMDEMRLGKRKSTDSDESLESAMRQKCKVSDVRSASQESEVSMLTVGGDGRGKVTTGRGKKPFADVMRNTPAFGAGL